MGSIYHGPVRDLLYIADNDTSEARWSSQLDADEVLDSAALIRKDRFATRLNRFAREDHRSRLPRLSTPVKLRDTIQKQSHSRAQPRDPRLGEKIVAAMRACGEAIREYWKPT